MDDNSIEAAGHLGLHVALCATFVAEPVDEPFQCWLPEMGVTASISFAPYNQVFQQLLDPSSLQAKNQSGVNVPSQQELVTKSGADRIRSPIVAGLPAPISAERCLPLREPLRSPLSMAAMEQIEWPLGVVNGNPLSRIERLLSGRSCH